VAVKPPVLRLCAGAGPSVDARSCEYLRFIPSEIRRRAAALIGRRVRLPVRGHSRTSNPRRRPTELASAFGDVFFDAGLDKNNFLFALGLRVVRVLAACVDQVVQPPLDLHQLPYGNRSRLASQYIEVKTTHGE